MFRSLELGEFFCVDARVRGTEHLFLAGGHKRLNVEVTVSLYSGNRHGNNVWSQLLQQTFLMAQAWIVLRVTAQHPSQAKPVGMTVQSTLPCGSPVA